MTKRVRTGPNPRGWRRLGHDGPVQYGASSHPASGLDFDVVDEQPRLRRAHQGGRTGCRWHSPPVSRKPPCWDGPSRVKFVAAFFNAEPQAERVFDRYRASLLRHAQETETVRDRPTVLYGSAYQGAWYIAGGQSYFANLAKDAGRAVSLGRRPQRGQQARQYGDCHDAGTERGLLDKSE